MESEKGQALIFISQATKISANFGGYFKQPKVQN